MDKTRMLMEIYQALWLSADFEEDLMEEFPTAFKMLKWNENQISKEELLKIMFFLNHHPAFT